MGAADLADDGVDFGDGLEGEVLFGEDVEGFADGGVGHGGGHVEVGAFVEGGHEFFAEAGEGLVGVDPEGGGAEGAGVKACAAGRSGNEGEEVVEADPDSGAGEDEQGGQ